MLHAGMDCMMNMILGDLLLRSSSFFLGALSNYCVGCTTTTPLVGQHAVLRDINYHYLVILTISSPLLTSLAVLVLVVELNTYCVTAVKNSCDT